MPEISRFYEIVVKRSSQQIHKLPRWNNEHRLSGAKIQLF